MGKPKMIGTINGRTASAFKFGKLTGLFDGTTLDLVRVAVVLGAVDGSVVQANYGGLSLDPRDTVEMRVYSNPRDERAGGFWATEVRS